ncbi:SRPBCC family protein [Ferdinandcohnia sp. Marseille-Q9671]
MLAAIEKKETGYAATFERHFTNSVEDVWAMLTDNEKLQKWFSELKVEDPRKGGRILFDMGDGTSEEMTITDFTDQSVLEYTWGDDLVRFELSSEQEGCQLVLLEKITDLTPHTPKDLAGWHVCLDVICALLAGEEVTERRQQWERWYITYTQEIDRLTK